MRKAKYTDLVRIPCASFTQEYNFLSFLCRFLKATMGPFAFLIFGAFSLMTTIFIFFFIPETKGRTFEDIVAGFRGQPLTQENEEGYNKNIYVTDGTVNQAFEGN